MLIVMEIPHENGIILSQRGVQANPCIRHCRSIINKEISLDKYVDMIISFFFMGLLCAWEPYGTHLGYPHMG